MIPAAIPVWQRCLPWRPKSSTSAQQPEAGEIPETFNMSTALLDCHLHAGRGDATAIVTPDGELTYEALWRLTNRAGNALRQAGVRREERVLILLPDAPEFIAVFLGAMRLGAVPVPVNTLSGPADYAYYLQDSRAATLVMDTGMMDRVGASRLGAAHLRNTIVMGETPADCLSLRDLLAAADDELDPQPTHRDEPSYWLYSSGTTGRPKGVVHRHQDMVHCTEAYARHVLGMTPEDRTYSASRLFFSYGLVNSLYLPLYSGASVALTSGRPDPASVLAAIERFAPTLFFGVPTFYAALLQHLDQLEAPARLESLRLAVSAGEALPAPMYHRWRDATGVELLDGIGSTEFGYIFISNHPDRTRAGSSGQVIEGFEARLVDTAERDVPDGEVGDLLVRGGSVGAGYWQKREQTQAAFLGSWLRTGDKYIRDSDGFFTFCGRSDDLMRVSGQWVSPLEVEAALLEHPRVVECAVVASADSDGLDRPRAFVVLTEPADGDSVALAEELRAHARARLAPFKAPRWIEIVSELPKTPTGKIQRFRLRTTESA